MARKPSGKKPTGISGLVAGQEKFLIMVLGAIAIFVQAYDCGCAASNTCAAHPCWLDQNIKNLITAIIVAAQGWLGTNSGSVTLEEGEVVADKADVDPGALTKPPENKLPDSAPLRPRPRPLELEPVPAVEVAHS